MNTFPVYNYGVIICKSVYFFCREGSNLIREEKLGRRCKRVCVVESGENIFVSSSVTLVGEKIDSRDLNSFRVTVRIYVTNVKKYFNIVVLIFFRMLCSKWFFIVDFISDFITEIVNLTFRRLNLTILIIFHAIIYSQNHCGNHIEHNYSFKETINITKCNHLFI